VKLRIGTRRSRLALAQAEEIAVRLDAAGVRSELVPMETAGDRGAPPDTSTSGLKGLFVAEISRALHDGWVDIAVHSAKDMAAEDEEDLVIAAVPERASPLDVLITREDGLPPGSVVATSSPRRQAQVARWRPDVRLQDLRGNVDTRLRKLEEGEVDALVLAAAGLLRLGVVPQHAQPMSVAEMVPAPGQGCLAVQARAADERTREALAPLDHASSRSELEAERALMRRMGGGCALPLGALASVEPDRIRLVAIVLSPDGTRLARTEVDAPTPEEAAEIAALDLMAGGADDILSAVRP
jgi:hydroxymethylbilane synthase